MDFLKNLRKPAGAFLRRAVVGTFCLWQAAAPALAAVPQTTVYQGSLRRSGAPYTGNATFVFRITDSTGGTQYWTSGSTVVAVTGSFFRYPLGTPNAAAFQAIDWANITPYVEVTVDGVLLLPREQLGAVPYSIYAGSLPYVSPGASGVQVSNNLLVSGNVTMAAGQTVVLGRAPASPNEAATKIYVDNNIGSTSSSSTWTAWQTYRNQVTLSTDVYMSAGQLNLQGNRVTTPAGKLDAAQLVNTVPVTSISGITDTQLSAGSFPKIGGVGTLTAGTWQGTPVGTTYGGTGSNLTPTAGTVLYGNGAALALTPVGTLGQVLQSNGAGAPSWVSPFQSSVLGSTNTWTAWQTFANQVTYSTDAYFSSGQINLQGNRVTTPAGKLDAAQLVNTVPVTSISGITDTQLSAGSFPKIGGVGTLSAGTWQGNPVGTTYGGTGANINPVAGAVVYGNGTTLAITPQGTAGQVLQSNGNTPPTWVNPNASSMLGSTNTWSAWQSFNNQISVSSDVYLSAGQLNLQGNRVTTPAGKLDATQLVNAVPITSISGITNAQLSAGTFSNITGVGNVTAGVWQGQVVDTAHGGTGRDLSLAAQGGVPYFQASAMGATAAGVAGAVLVSGGSGAPVWSAQSALAVGMATNLAAGVAGSMPYQGAVGTTAMLAPGTAGDVFSSNGGAAPSWITPTSAATADTLVKRNGTGDFSAHDITVNTVTGSLTGTASNNVLKSGDSMTGTLTFAGVVNDITTDTNEDLVIMPNGSGKVGIGTATPSAKLHIGGTPGVDGIKFPDGSLMTSASLGSAGSMVNTTNAMVQADSDSNGSGDIVMRTGATDRMTIKNDGLIGIGVFPLRKLHIADTSVVEMILQGSDGAADKRMWNFGVSGAASAAKDFWIRQLNDAGSGGYTPLTIRGSDGNVRVGANGLYVAGPLDLGADMTMAAANPTITSGGSYINIPNGLYISGGSVPLYSEASIRPRGGIKNDTGAALVIEGGTGGHTHFTGAGSVGIGTTNPGYKLEVAGDVYVNGGWLRTSGAAGWYSESYGGGWRMSDSTWIRSYGSKDVYINTFLRADGGIASGNVVSDGAGTIHATGAIRTESNLRVDGQLTCLQGTCPSNSVMRLTPNLHLNSGGGSAVILNWDNGTTGATRTLRIGDGAGADVFDVLANGNVGIGTTSPGAKLSFGGLVGSPAIFNYDGGAAGSRYGVGTNSSEFQFFIPTAAHYAFTTGGDLTAVGSQEVMRVNGTGNVGIGTTNPTARLHVRASAGVPTAFIDTWGSSAPDSQLTIKRSAAQIGYNPWGTFPSAVMIQSNDDTRFLWLSAGQNNPAATNARIRVAGTGLDFYTAGTVNDDGVYAMSIGSNGSPAYLGPLQMASGAYVSDAGVWNNASSREYKKDIRPLDTDKAMQTLLALEPVTYEYKAAAGKTYVGFIAEDVPELVASESRKGLSPMDIVAVLTKVVQRQQEQIASLESRLEKLAPDGPSSQP